MAIQHTPCTEFLEDYGSKFNPKAIIVFTAHWESEILTISSTDDIYETIYDFRGFPDELFRVKYPAKGSTELAQTIGERFQSAGIPIKFDTSKGLDHGTWVPLLRLFPTPPCPVVQISVHPFLSPEAQYKIGAALRGSDQEDILIVGSGATFHNFGVMDFRATEPDPRALAFDNWLVEKIQQQDYESLFQYEQLAPYGKMAVPRPEHFVPLYIALGSGDPDREAKVIHQSYEYGTLSYLSISF